MTRVLIATLALAAVAVSCESVAFLRAVHLVGEMTSDIVCHKQPVSSLSGCPLTEGSGGQKAGAIIKVAASNGSGENDNQQEDDGGDGGENKDDKQDPSGPDRLWDAPKQG